ncbi:MAG TPA: hypothetical protein VF824_02215 [Thermoanaerobaculia bacterium]|jgi:hypothetical protein
MPRLPLLLLLLLSLLAVAAQGQEYEKVLVPISLNQTLGAFGSVWHALLTISNVSETPVSVGQRGSCITGPCTPPPIPPHATVHEGVVPVSEVPASFLFVDKGRLDDVNITIRTFDRSRLNRTWGATIPVVTRRDCFTGRFGINDIPAGNDFRSSLRIYDFDAVTPGAVRVRIYRLAGFGPGTPVTATPDELLATLEPGFTPPVSGGGTAGHPGYASIALSALPELGGVERIRVEIEPLDTTGDYWAFVSATHNETQQVTIIAPR